jgi:peptidoglycan/xylan/chitin deacetylase (PgdA/CDA1 family)
MISIVIPALNEERNIRECLESLLKQDYAGDYEIIVADNGSTDRTAEIVREMQGRLVSCLRKGVSFARQAGADAAIGEIIIQTDADTVYPSWWLSRVAEQFKKHPEAAAISGRFIYKTAPWWGRVEYALRLAFNYSTYKILGRPYAPSGANFAFYKKYLLQMGGYDHYSYSPDQYNISSRLSRFGRVVFDRGSWCKTSSRSVSKPLYVVLKDLFRHIRIFFNYLAHRTAAAFPVQRGKVGRFSTKTAIKVLVPIILVGLLCYGYFVPTSPVFGKVYARAATPEKVIALTFDDGPNEPYTSQVLTILENEGVHATFFLVGANVKLYPETARRMLVDGDVIGNHTYSHDANHALEFNAYKDIQLAQETIYAATGVKPHLYRPPHGKKSPWELQAIKGEGYLEVLWSISTPELSGASPAAMAQNIVRQANRGGIILMHDGYGTQHGPGRPDKEATVQALPLIIDQLKAEGYTFVTVPELLHVPAYDQATP